MADAKDRARRKVHRIYEDAVSRSQSDPKDYSMAASIKERLEEIEGAGGTTVSIPTLSKGKWVTLTVAAGDTDRKTAALLPTVQSLRQELPELFAIIRKGGSQ